MQTLLAFSIKIDVFLTGVLVYMHCVSMYANFEAEAAWLWEEIQGE